MPSSGLIFPCLFTYWLLMIKKDPLYLVTASFRENLTNGWVVLVLHSLGDKLSVYSFKLMRTLAWYGHYQT